MSKKMTFHRFTRILDQAKKDIAMSTATVSTSRALTWGDLRTVPQGTRVVFTTTWDIYPYTVVKEGEHATITVNDLTGGFPVLYMLPDNPAIRTILDEWDGEILIAPINDGCEWTDESPLTLAQVEA